MNRSPSFAFASRILASALLGLLFLGTGSLARAGNLADGVSIVPAGSPVLTTNIPDPSACTVTPCDQMVGVVVSPNVPNPIPATEVEVVVRNQTGSPIADAAVVFQNLDNDLVCPSAVLSGTTDAAGRVRFTLAGGGCKSDVPLAAVIKANGVTIRNYSNVKSPDFDGSGADLVVNLADLVQFSAEFLGNGPAVCHDYDNNGTTDLGDLIIFSPAFVAGAHCP